MAEHGQHTGDVGPADALAASFEAVAADWIRRVVTERAAHHDPASVASLRDEIDAMARRVAPEVSAELTAVLRTDVDEQVGNPLAVLRSAVTGEPTELLRRVGVAPVDRDEFERRSFPDDPYGLGPATWADVDESLHEPGIVWGAWKAATVLARRRGSSGR